MPSRRRKARGAPSSACTTIRPSMNRLRPRLLSWSTHALPIFPHTATRHHTVLLTASPSGRLYRVLVATLRSHTPRSTGLVSYVCVGSPPMFPYSVTCGADAPSPPAAGRPGRRREHHRLCAVRPGGGRFRYCEPCCERLTAVSSSGRQGAQGYGTWRGVRRTHGLVSQSFPSIPNYSRLQSLPTYCHLPHPGRAALRSEKSAFSRLPRTPLFKALDVPSYPSVMT